MVVREIIYVYLCFHGVRCAFDDISDTEESDYDSRKDSSENKVISKERENNIYMNSQENSKFSFIYLKFSTFIRRLRSQLITILLSTFFKGIWTPPSKRASVNTRRSNNLKRPMKTKARSSITPTQRQSRDRDRTMRAERWWTRDGCSVVPVNSTSNTNWIASNIHFTRSAIPVSAVWEWCVYFHRVSLSLSFRWNRGYRYYLCTPVLLHRR